MVEELAEFGAGVYTCARTESELDERLKEWKDAGLTVTGSVCDVSSRPEREKLMQDVSSAFGGKLNILVNVFTINNIIMHNSSIVKRKLNPLKIKWWLLLCYTKRKFYIILF